jgi:hypothetical protein
VEDVAGEILAKRVINGYEKRGMKDSFSGSAE